MRLSMHWGRASVFTPCWRYLPPSPNPSPSTRRLVLALALVLVLQLGYRRPRAWAAADAGAGVGPGELVLVLQPRLGPRQVVGLCDGDGMTLTSPPVALPSPQPASLPSPDPAEGWSRIEEAKPHKSPYSVASVGGNFAGDCMKLEPLHLIPEVESFIIGGALGKAVPWRGESLKHVRHIPDYPE